jgi:hypothetical protein
LKGDVNLKKKLKSLKESLKNKKGMNSIEATIIIVILLLCIMTMLDLMEINQKMSATTSAVNYMTRLVGRQGGISNGTPTNFSSYGHGSYVTTNSAWTILNDSLQKAFSVTDGSDVLGDQVKMYIEVYDVNAGVASSSPKTVIELTEDTEFGVYIESSHISDDLLIHQQDILYHQVYYVVTAEMYYPAFTVQRLITFSDSYFTESETYLKYKKTFSRFIIPTYYNRTYENESDYTSVNIAAEWYVK